MSLKPKRTALSDIRYTIYDIRYTIYDIRYLCSFVWPWGYSVRCWVGMCHWDTETFLISGTCPYSLHYGSTNPWTLKCFAFASLDQQELYFNVISNALFCVLQVWQDSIRFVVQRLLTRDTNFHSSKHIRNYTQDGFANLRFEYERRGRNEPTRLNVFVFCCEVETLCK